MNWKLPTGYRVILASGSPRRRELLESVGLRFETIPPSASAEPDGQQLRADETPAQFVERLAYQKAADVASRFQAPAGGTSIALVIGCDTVAEVDGLILGKPRDRANAQSILEQLSGRQHSVWSGLCVIESNSGQMRSGYAESRLVMKALSQAELVAYLDSGQWQGKSGAFGYQDGHPWLQLISGTAENVVGLPIDVLEGFLKSFKGRS